MARAGKTLFREVEGYVQSLRGSFEKERWNEAAEALQGVAEIAQNLQRVEVSLMAQALKIDLSNRARQESPAIFAEFSDRYEELLQRLDHLSWAAEG